MNRITTTALATVIGGFALLAMTACQAGPDGSGAPAQASVLAGQIASVVGQTAGSQASDSSSAPAGASAPGSPGAADSPSQASSVADPAGPDALPKADAPAGSVAIGSGAAGNAPTTSAPSTTAPAGNLPSGSAPTGNAPTSNAPTSNAPSTTSAASSPAPSIVSASISCDFSSDDQTYHENLTYEVAGATGMALSIDNPGIVGSFGTYDWHGTIEIPSLGCYSENGPQTYTLYTVGGTGPQASKTIVRTGTHTHAHAGSTSGTTTSTAATPAPSIVSASISCDFSSDDQTYHENLSYEVAGATGMALSIDNPGIVGSFGTYDWHGTIEIPSLGCYSENGPQTYTLYTVGGTGPQASKTIVRTGTHTHSSSTTTASTPGTTSDETSQLPTPSASSQLPTPSAPSSASGSTSGN